jgi:hypothetical protein
VTVVWNGGEERPQKLGGPADLSDMVLTQAYRPQMHQTIMRRWRKVIGRQRLVVHISDLDADGVVIGDPRTFPNALLINCTDPDVDWASGNQADWSITLALGEEV